MKSNPRTLQVSPDVQLPIQIVTHRNAVIGTSGCGKSNACVVLAEEMHRCDVPWCYFDPKGDTWGFRSSANGKGAGLDVPIIGGDHADLPLSPRQGSRMAELVAAGKLTGVFDLSDFAHDRQELARFMTDFGTSLLRHQKTPIHLFLDEADEYLPQPGAGGTLDGLVAKCVSAWKRLATKGRQRGIGYTLISQRCANVNKSALYMCETLIAMRTTGKRDKISLRDFVEAHGQADELVKSLPSLEDGEAWIWSPVRLRMMQRTRFRRRATFDSGRTPEIGEAHVVPKLTALDFKALRAEFDALATDADPEEAPKNGGQQGLAYRQRIADLEAEVQRLKQEAVQVRKRVLAAVGAESPEVDEPEHDSAAVVHRETKPLKSRTNAVDQSRVAAGNVAHSGLGKCARNLLIALAQHGDLSLVQAAIIAGYASDSGGVRNAAGELRTSGFAEGSNAMLSITAQGRALVSDAPRLPTGKKLAQYWYGKLARAERNILSEVLAVYPSKLSLTEAAKRSGYAPDSGGVRNAAGKLRTLNLVSGSNRGMTGDKRLV